MTAATYARFSSEELQNEHSLEDQVRLCEAKIARDLPEPGRSGTSTMRASPGRA